MPEVLEIEETEVKRRNLDDAKIASWLVDIPSNILEALDLAAGSRVALTIIDDEVSGTVLPPMSDEMKKISRRILEKNRRLYEEMKQLGD